MAIVPLPLHPNIAARALLHHLLEHGDVLGKDAGGRTVITWRWTTGPWRGS